MLYVAIGAGIVLIPCGIYVLVKANQIKEDTVAFTNQRKGAFCILGLAFLFIIIPATIIKNEAKPDAETAPVQQQTIKQLTFNEFKNAYEASSKRFAAPIINDWTVSNGEKANTVKIQISSVSNILISMKKEAPNHLIGTMFFVSASDDSLAVLQALTAFYALTAVFEPQKNDEQIADLVNQILDAEKNTDYSLSGGMLCSVNSVGGTEIITYRYE